ncbi:hypothetical protein FRC01_012661 [Tulasnella sp. 417]|nr:hypothetical protein FRC01_012661 [Tulasnella sp. 417]
MHRAISIPEIVHMIFSEASRGSLRNAALTCTQWKEPALDQLWRVLDSVFPLLWILIPLKLESEHDQSEKTVWTALLPFPRPKTWNRLETYTRRVRVLYLDAFPTTGDIVAFQTFQTTVQFRPPGKELLPNLRKLIYNARNRPQTDALSVLAALLVPSIVELKLLGVPLISVPDFLDYLTQRTPRVRNLLIEGPPPSYIGSSTLSSNLLRLENLTSFELGSTALTPGIWDAMTQLPSLVSAGFPLLPPAPDATGFQPKAFAKLGSLSIRGDFPLLCDLFGSQNDLPTITRIDFRGRSVEEGRSDFRRLCRLLARKLPNLTSVRLDCRTTSLEADVPLKLVDFQHLLQCEKLRIFHLEHPCGVSLTIGEVAEVLEAWSLIEMLALQYSTFIRGSINSLKWTAPTLPLNVLDTVAAKAPRIKELRLVVDAAIPIQCTPAPCQQQFECLQEFEVTLSIVRQPRNVASYLAQRSKNPFSLKVVSAQQVQEDAVQIVNEAKRKWDQVGDHLKLLFDQKQRPDRDLQLGLVEERARYIQEFGEVAASLKSVF